jgi:hypothetical protein
MAHFVGLDVSVKETSVCVVDDASTVVLEQRVPLENVLTGTTGGVSSWWLPILPLNSGKGARKIAPLHPSCMSRQEHFEGDGGSVMA